MSEDLLADTFERVLRSRPNPARRRASEKPWLYAIALNCLRDSARRATVETRAVERLASEPVPRTAELASVLDGDDRRDRVRQALAALADEEREAIGLRFGGGLTVPEIARLLGQPLTTVESRVYRGLRKLRERLT